MNPALKIAAVLALLAAAPAARAQDGAHKAPRESRLTRRDARLHKGMRHDRKMEKSTPPRGMRQPQPPKGERRGNKDQK